MTKYLTIALMGLMLASCSTEKVNLSPVYDSYSTSANVSIQNYPERFSDKTSQNFYASELINQISTFPNFQNSGLDKEVTNLKYQVKQYVYALQEYNKNGRENALGKVEKSYKKIQKLRKFLNPDEDQVINRYLVRIKSNIAQLESMKTKDSLSSN